MPLSAPHVLALFAKWPTPGTVKTRLNADPVRAAAAARAFLLDALARYATLADRRVVVFAPPDAGPHFRAAAGADFDLVPQTDGDLGHRLRRFVRAPYNDGVTRLVLVGADSPTLPVEYVRRAFADLDRADVVLGPASDGGYYLIGFALERTGVAVPDAVLNGIPWSTDRVLETTVERVKGLGRPLALLPAWYDVDTPDDWALLRAHVAAWRRAGVDPGVPHTEALLREEPS